MIGVKMVNRDVLVEYLDRYLDIYAIGDACANGLEVDGAEQVGKIVFMVDASEEGFLRAVECSADMVIVHHGLFFGHLKKITGNLYKRIKILIDNNISLYAAHLPLDVHPVLGNNAQIAKLFSLKNLKTYSLGGYDDIMIVGELPSPLQWDDFLAKTDECFKTESRFVKFGPDKIKKVAVISGSGCEAVEMSAGLGADVFLTGESKLSAYHIARESGINVVFAGHYNTEVFGLQALMKHIGEKYHMNVEFIDIPTDL